MSDSIYRHDAIKAIETSRFLIDAIEKVMMLPSAQPKTGKWIKPTGMMPPEYVGVYRCSECGEIAMRDWKRHYQTLTNYCPNCGAKMKLRGEEHEIN